MLEIEGESRFDAWMKKHWPEKHTKPPTDKLLELAEKICANDDTFGDHESEEKHEYYDDPKSPLDSWEGISVDWFQNVFMELPEVKNMMEFGCRMWFLRYAGIKVIMKRRNIPSGPLVEHLEVLGTSNISGTPIKSKKATTFVSFTGSYTIKHFSELLQKLSGHFVWIDTFCVNQFAWTERRDDDIKAFKRNFMTRLRSMIDEIGSTALMLEQWDNWMSTLGQVWVIWEIFSTADSPKADLIVLLSDEEHERFVEFGLRRQEQFDSLQIALASIDANKADAFDTVDKIVILKEMKKKGGVSMVNTRVMEQMRKWLVATGRTRLERDRATGELCSVLTNNLALLYRDMGDYVTAVSLLRDTLTMDQVDLEAELTTLGNLAIVLKDMNQLDEARELYRQALHCSQQTFGDIHESTLFHKRNMALFLMEEDKYREAEPLFSDILAARRHTLGDSDEKTCVAFDDMSTVLAELGKPQDAVQYSRYALKSRRSNLGNRHSHTLASIAHLASTLLRLGRLDEAEELSLEALAIHREKLGQDHPDTLSSIQRMAVVHEARGRIDEAASFGWRALNGFRRNLVDGHAEIQISIWFMTILHFKQGDAETAEPLCREIVSIRQAQLGESNPATIEAMSLLSNVLASLGQYDEAVKISKRALDVYRKDKGNGDPMTFVAVGNVAHMLKDQGKLKSAKPYYKEALDGRLVHHYANLLIQLGEHVDETADPLLRDAWTTAILDGKKDGNAYKQWFFDQSKLTISSILIAVVIYSLYHRGNAS